MNHLPATAAMPFVLGAASDVFTHAHIAFTAACTAVIAFGFGVWRFQGKRRWLDAGTVAVLVAGAVYLWRASANMPQLNNDGLPGYSANDWLAPAITYITLSVYADLFPPIDQRRFAQVRAAATIAAFAINVITI
jgi:hypothetical protein